MSRPSLQRGRVDDTFRYVVEVDGRRVHLEKRCLSQTESEYGAAGYEEFGRAWTAAEFLASEEAQALLVETHGLAVLNDVLAALGAPTRAAPPAGVPAELRAPARDGEPDGASRQHPPAATPAAPPSPAPPSRWALGMGAAGNALFAVALVAGLWAVTGLPGWWYVRRGLDSVGQDVALRSESAQVTAEVLGTRGPRLATHAVGGKGSSSPLRRYEANVLYRARVEGFEREGMLTLTEPFTVDGEASLARRLTRYSLGAPVALRCAPGPGEACVLDERPPGASRLLLNALQALFGLFLILLMPGLLLVAVRESRRR